jgi:hypothetical protein
LFLRRGIFFQETEEKERETRAPRPRRATNSYRRAALSLLTGLLVLGARPGRKGACLLRLVLTLRRRTGPFLIFKTVTHFQRTEASLRRRYTGTRPRPGRVARASERAVRVARRNTCLALLYGSACTNKYLPHLCRTVVLIT